MVTPKRYVHILISRTCDYDFILEKTFCRCNYVKGLEMRNHPRSSRRTLNIMTGVPVRGKQREMGDRQRGEGT